MYKPPENNFLTYSAKIKPIDPELLAKSGALHSNQGSKSPIRTYPGNKTTLSKGVPKTNNTSYTNHQY